MLKQELNRLLARFKLGLWGKLFAGSFHYLPVPHSMLCSPFPAPAHLIRRRVLPQDHAPRTQTLKQAKKTVSKKYKYVVLAHRLSHFCNKFSVTLSLYTSRHGLALTKLELVSQSKPKSLTNCSRVRIL